MDLSQASVYRNKIKLNFFLGKAKLLSRGGVRGSKVVFLCILIHGSGVLSFCWVSVLTVNLLITLYLLYFHLSTQASLINSSYSGPATVANILAHFNPLLVL